jgi:hypothetical protein
VAQRVAAAAETAKLGSRSGTFLRVLAVGNGLGSDVITLLRGFSKFSFDFFHGSGKPPS